MADYQKMYYTVCSAASKAIDMILAGEIEAAQKMLQTALLDAEEQYITSSGNEP